MTDGEKNAEARISETSCRVAKINFSKIYISGPMVALQLPRNRMLFLLSAQHPPTRYP